MRLSSLYVKDLRRVAEATLQLSPATNLIHGVNGSGKTSLLEAVHYLAAARSFRTNRVSEVIREGSSSLIVRGEFTDSLGQSHRIGVEKTRSLTRLRVNGAPESVASKIARLVPLLTFNSESFQILDGGPSNRRALLDRLLFHVEQQYFDTLKAYFRALKQRNSALRMHAPRKDVALWNEQLIKSATQVDDWRENCTSRINRYLLESPLQERLDGVCVEYRRGWPADSSLQNCLEQNIARDSEVGFTSAGPHRAELRIRIKGKSAKSSVSRGQGKLIIGAIIGAQARYLKDELSMPPIMLVDDLAAELDKHARALALDVLAGTGGQLLVTAIEQDDLSLEPFGEIRRFHVEHGVVSQN